MADFCVIFDLDGTLVDSEALNSQAFSDLLPDLKENIAVLAERYRGQHLGKILPELEACLGRSLPADFETHYRARVAELYVSMLEPTPGTVELLEQHTFPRCVASSAPLKKIQHALDVCEISKHFSGNLFSSHEIGSWKPEPTLFLHAAKQMGFPPERCVVIEDSKVGIDAAVSAGMQVLQFASHEAVADPRANRIVRNMTEVPRYLHEVCFASAPHRH